MTESTGWLLGGRYRVLERLGAGGMAEVFRAHDETLNRDVAVKVFRTVVDDPDDPGAEARRELELHALARLNHPHLVTLYDGSVTETPAFLVMELVDGPTLAQRLREGPLPEAEAVELGAQIASALTYVHANDMVHRDVKPANILLGGDGDGGVGPAAMRARLSDFGIVRLLDGSASRMTAIGRTMGTASYLAPEQARGLDVGAPADVYSLGLVLIETLTGTPSFDGPLEEVVAARLSGPPAIPADLPQPWPGLLSQMTADEPSARPDAATVAATLRGTSPVSALAALPTSAVPPVFAAQLPADVSPTAATGAIAATGPGPVVAPVVAPLPVGDERRARDRTGRSGLAWVLGAFALVAILAGGLITALALTGGSNSPGSGTPQPTDSARHVPGPGGKTLAANTHSAHSGPVSSAPATDRHSHTHSVSSSSTPPSSSAPPSSSSAPSTPRTSHSTVTRTSRPPSSSSSAVSTSASSSTRAPVRSTSSSTSAAAAVSSLAPSPP